ncbi:MAG: NUDIX hydrolase [Desulfatiglans sp.]|jgi:ADP-ribose pyrophosphatase|nr:NUDIX hydrolase [Thermodesulfobacteriota bacterium]MEE4351872.1 NUDIX hydrolase [Desulfatiglans sp.]
MLAKVNRRVTIHEGRVFQMVSENITLANGASVNMEIIHHPGASAIVPFSDQDTIVLLQQYRHALRESIWEIPAGTLHEDETPIECAKRELKEETGFLASTWRELGQITPVPGYSDERIHLFLAFDLTRAEQTLDEDEMIEVRWKSVHDIMNMIAAGEITDGKTISGFFLARELFHREGGQALMTKDVSGK